MFSIHKSLYGNIPDNKYPVWMRFVFFSYDPAVYPSSHNVATCSHSSLTHYAESPSTGTYLRISLNYFENLCHKIASARSIFKKVPQKLLHSTTYTAENCSHAGSASKFAEHCGGMKCTTKTETDAKSNSCQ
jgi:hypothetical protein